MKPSASQAAKGKNGRKRKNDGADPETMAKRKKIREQVERFRARAAGDRNAPEKLKPGPKPSQL